MKKPRPQNYQNIKGELMLESFLVDMALYYLDKYDRKKIPLLHMAITKCAEDAVKTLRKQKWTMV